MTMVQVELNGSASDSRSEGWEFESLWPHMAATGTLVFLSLTHNPLPETLKGKERCSHLSQRVFHAASIFRLLLKVAVEHMHQCE